MAGREEQLQALRESLKRKIPKKKKEEEKEEVNPKEQACMAAGMMLQNQGKTNAEKVTEKVNADPVLAGIIWGLLEGGSIQQVVTSGTKYIAPAMPGGSAESTPMATPEATEDEGDPRLPPSMKLFRNLNPKILAYTMPQIADPAVNEKYGLDAADEDPPNVWDKVAELRAVVIDEVREAHPVRRGKDPLAQKTDHTWDQELVEKKTIFHGLDCRILQCAVAVKNGAADLPLMFRNADRVPELSEILTGFYAKTRRS